MAFPKIKKCELFLAGGFVRDSILNIESKDQDYVVVTELSFEQLLKSLKKMPNCLVYLAKPEFLTIRCNINGDVVDLALPRSESDYDDNRHPNKVGRVATLKEDSSRRDFTINSMYMDESGKITDYWGGQKDIKDKVIKCVGDPYLRFEEDYLRILRALRFAIKFDFKIEQHTWEAMYDLSEKVREIEPNRIREELNKCLLINPERTMFYLFQLELFEELEAVGLKFQITSKELK